MKQLFLSFVNGNSYRVEGAVKDLLSNKRARMMLRSQLAFKPAGDSILVENEEGIEKIAAILGLVSRYIGATVVFDERTSSTIADYKLREENFSRFSKEAKDIKENHCNPREFKEFSEILHMHMPARHLYPLQVLSAYHLSFSQNGCNFSVPGAGKTSIVYGAFTFLKNCSDTSKQVDQVLIIGPLSSFGPWENEYEECFGVKANCQRISGLMTAEQKKQYFYGKTAELTLISYQSVINLKDELSYYLQNNRVMVVLDEAHKVKSTNGGIIASVIMDLAKWCRSRVVLTGTPAPNGYEDLYNLFHFIWPQFDVVKYNVGQLRDMTRTDKDPRVPKLLDNISPFYVRIRKSDLNLPSATENEPIIVQMKESQRRIYDFIEERFVDEANKESRDGALRRILVRAKMIRLLQAATNPALLSEPLSALSEDFDEDFSLADIDDSAIMKDIVRFYDGEVPSKYEQCLNLVRQIINSGGKVIIWAVFVKNIESLSEFLTQNGIECRTLYGATPIAGNDIKEEDRTKTREGIVKEFNSQDSSFKVVIANPFAVAESISLHKACHNAIYLERSFNCAHYLQSKDRIHRYGLPKGVSTNYYYLLSEDSIDETINDRLKEKEQRMLDIIENSPIPLFMNVTEEGDADIKAILDDYVRRKARKIY